MILDAIRIAKIGQLNYHGLMKIKLQFKPLISISNFKSLKIFVILVVTKASNASLNRTS